MRQRWLTFTIVAAAAPALADPDETEINSAPPPGAESGRVDHTPKGSTGLEIANSLLFVPRGAVELVLLPFRGAIWANERYEITQRARKWFFNDQETMGLYPLVLFESTVGALVGAQFVMGLAEHSLIEVFGGIGLSSRYRADVELRSNGHLGGRLGITVRGDYDARPETRFYGVGDGDEIDTPAMPINAYNGVVATKSLYTDKLARAAAGVDFRLFDSTYVEIAGAYQDRRRDVGSEGPFLPLVFMPNPGIDFEPYQAGYGELGLRYDTRRARSYWEPSGLDSQGSLASVFAGLESLDPGTSFLRYGFDAQHFIAIGSGPRVIMVRAQAEAITAAADTVPFPELPSLGGRARLRGYPLDRFRDRIAAVATGEYEYALSHYVFASLFVDVGRVYPSLDDLSVDNMRCGFGLGLEAHTQSSFVARVSVASSIDGGVFFNFYLDPVYSVEPRVRRR